LITLETSKSDRSSDLEEEKIPTGNLRILWQLENILVFSHIRLSDPQQVEERFAFFEELRSGEDIDLLLLQVC